MLEKTMMGKSTRLGIASVMLHEALHAELLRAIYAQDETVDILGMSTFDLIWLASNLQEGLDIDAFSSTPDANNPLVHHLAMITSFRNVIKTGLYKFVGIKDLNTEDVDEAYYQDNIFMYETIEALSWGGLMGEAKSYGYVGEDGLMNLLEFYETFPEAINIQIKTGHDGEECGN
ncbi:MAG: hypothetical protein ACPGJS_00025 [Flammeovirgaceae bacterium]